MSFILGGSLMTLTDLVARTVISPSELPVGAITALIGAPFFAWVYFRKNYSKKTSHAGTKARRDKEEGEELLKKTSHGGTADTEKRGNND
jgi:hypothetical protein